MSDKQKLYNCVFSLLEEELYQRMNPKIYNDKPFDKTNNKMIGGNSNGNSSDNVSNLFPGKLDIIRNSYHLPIDIAIKGSVDRQKLFLKEQSKF